jgi:mRNA interferase MazF
LVTIFRPTLELGGSTAEQIASFRNFFQDPPDTPIAWRNRADMVPRLPKQHRISEAVGVETTRERMAGFDNRLGFSFGDTIVASYAVSNQDEVEARPAVIISSETYNQQRSDVLVMAISARDRPNADSGELSLHAAEAAGLDRGAVFTPVIATVPQQRVRLILGQLHDTDRARLSHLLDLIIGN